MLANRMLPMPRTPAQFAFRIAKVGMLQEADCVKAIEALVEISTCIQGSGLSTCIRMGHRCFILALALALLI